MKKIISIAFAAILAGLAISCQKEELVSDKTDAVQYTFNITVADQVGFDSDASTKGASGPSYKSAWENGDKIFLFFKPTEGSLLTNTYATLTYNESAWGGSVTGSTSLGEGGTLSAVYVYKLDGSVTPAYSDSKWTIATGNTFYNCQTGVDYTVSGSEISASLNLVAPADFVCFSIYGTSNGSLTCDKVTGWKDVVIGGEMTFSNATCTGYMTGINNNYNGNSYQDYYGRIVGGGTSLKGVTCKFSVVKDGKVYEHTATPSSDKRSFYMDVRTDGTNPWTVAAGKLPGLFTVGKGADGKAGTADDVKVRFSQGNLWYGKVEDAQTATFNFEGNQYSISSTWNADHVSNFYWNKDASLACAKSNDETGASASDNFFTNSDETTAKTDFTVNGQTNVWRTLSHDEWKYLFENHTYKYVSVNGKYGIVIVPDGFSGTIADSYDATGWATAESNGLVFLPNTGYRTDSDINETEKSCFYWTSTALGNQEEEYENCYFAYRVFFQWDNGSLKYEPDSKAHREWAIGIRLITDASAAPAPGSEYVTIGGKKWATMNLGATTVAGTLATCAGNYFAWGEIEPYYNSISWNGTTGSFSSWKSGKDSGYAWQSYCGQTSFTEWSTLPYDNTTKLLKGDYDVAKQTLGGNWRMPTSQEFQDLYDACGGSLNTSTNPGKDTSVGKGVYWCTSYDGVAGCLFCDGTNKLFFPAAGRGDYTNLNDSGSTGYYWSSTHSSTQDDHAISLYFTSGSVAPKGENLRYHGRPVRPVSD